MPADKMTPNRPDDLLRLTAALREARVELNNVTNHRWQETNRANEAEAARDDWEARYFREKADGAKNN